MRIAYIAYPTNLMLASANAIQTFTTLRELRKLAPDTLAIVPRWLKEPSRFLELGAVHLQRPAIGKLSRLYRSTLWYYAERSVFAAMTAAVVAKQQRSAKPIDVIYVREVICAGWWSAVWGPLLGIPVIYEAHDLESWNPSRAKEKLAQPMLNMLDKISLTRSSAVSSLTDEFRQLLARLEWRDPSEVAVIPDAFDEQHIAPGDRAAAREQLGMSAETKLLAYSGMTFSYRGLERLIEAYAILRKEDENLRLALVGGRQVELDGLRAQAREFGVEDEIIWTGQIPRDQITPYLHAADLLVIPDTVTDVTASPLKLFEYLAAERAVVLPDIPALAEVLSPEIGYYFRRADTQDLARALRQALSDPDRAAREQAGYAAVAKHTYTARAQAILDLAESTVQRYGTIPN
jgi:glycosyltransferase involved in cell wall biosynthesis